MDEQRRQVLRMLADGKITADEAERLIDALERDLPRERQETASRQGNRRRYLRVMVVDAADTAGEGPSRVDIRVPLQLLRAGVRLTSLLPPRAVARANEELRRSGVPIDLAELKPKDLEELVDQLDEVSVDVEDPEAKVRIFCE
ncbi:SHOCT-like domain-containing protein [Streptomyces sp. NPDC015144]|uniref:SHOCT-like domain-containing protein n=1 Tax=Streptomyces sp. NPDC015144 TaxID=3364944 RepID=UPI0037008BA5